EEPGKVAALHDAFIAAGADIVLTNTFGGNARRLALHGLEGRVGEVNARAAAIARGCADRAGRRVVVAGSVGPTGDLFAPLGPLTEDEATVIFAAQMRGLREGGADLAWIETMSAAEEMRAAARAAASVGMPFAITGSFDTAGRTMMGLTPEAFAQFASGLDPAPEAFGANCGVGASDLLLSLTAMRAAAPGAALIAKANAGVPQWHGDHVHYSGSPALMADYAALARDAGASIVGGCCGTAPEHLAAMRRALDEAPRRAPPDLAAILAATGPLASPPRAEGAGDERRARRRH
ncbi:MAG: betaine--homocysteine S-methyltransferase, partial [Hyphomicrobiales bacterium]|nr:betaine--homocysteine S-methyltransferase [Hyphomicrobiales bacterium]